MSKTSVLVRPQVMLHLVTFPAETPRLHRLRKAGAVLAGFSSIFLVSSLLDEAVRAAGLSDPQGVFGFIYRSVVGAGGCYLTARLSPGGLAEHLVARGALAFLLSIAAAVAVFGLVPLTLVASVLPAALLGARLGSDIDSVR